MNRVKELSTMVVDALAAHRATHEETLSVCTVLVRYICDTRGLSLEQTMDAFKSSLDAFERGRAKHDA